MPDENPWTSRVTLLDLLAGYDKVSGKLRSIATLATAIERNGIFGRDDYDRVKGPDDPEIRENALELLRQLNAAYRKNEFCEHQDYENHGVEMTYLDYDSPLQFYWWPKNALPNFDAIEKGQLVAAQNPEMHPKARGTLHMVIAGLLDALNIDPEKRAQAQVVSGFVQQIGGILNDDKAREILRDVAETKKRRKLPPNTGK